MTSDHLFTPRYSANKTMPVNFFVGLFIYSLFFCSHYEFSSFITIITHTVSLGTFALIVYVHLSQYCQHQLFKTQKMLSIAHAFARVPLSPAYIRGFFFSIVETLDDNNYSA